MSSVTFHQKWRWKSRIFSPPPTQPLRTTCCGKPLPATERERLRQLLAAEELGDRRPSQLLRHMYGLLGARLPTFDKSLLKELFLSRLPPQTRMVLAALPESSIDALADVADRVIEVSRATVAHIPAPAPSPPHVDIPRQAEPPLTQPPHTVPDPVSLLRQEVQELRNLIQDGLTCNASQPTSPRQQPSRRPARSRFRSPRDQRVRSQSPRPRRLPSPPQGCEFCWYHFNFGASARKCTPPCQWPGNDPGRR